MKKTIRTILFLLLLIGAFTVVFDVERAFTQADQTIYINTDGSVSPSTAPIETSDNVTYVFVDNVSEEITVQRNNIIIDGNGHTLTPTPSNDYGFNLTNVDNVTITNVALTSSSQNIPAFLLVNANDSQIVHNNITGDRFGITFGYGISLTSCFGNNVSNNRNTGTTQGIALYNSGNNVLSNNRFDSGIFSGINLYSSDNNTLIGNFVSGYALFYGPGYTVEGSLDLSSSDNNTLVGNDVTVNGQGVMLEGSDNNVLIANNITWNHGSAGFVQFNPPLGFGICIESSSNNTIYHNNLVGNVCYELIPPTYKEGPVPRNVMSDGSPNVWDNGYASGGNYWSDCLGVDVRSGPSQDLPGSDDICDTSYIIDANNVDHYPLMMIYGAPPSEKHALTIMATPGGTTNPLPGTYPYAVGISVQVLATPKANFTFDHWELDTVNVGSASSHTVIMDNNHILRAVMTNTPGDVDRNGKVDMDDISIVLDAFGSFPTHPRWNVLADMNENGRIEMADIITVLINFGRHYL